MSDPKVFVCDICGRVLDLRTDEQGATYVHTFQDCPADHEPVPVEAPPGYRGGRCDFCNVDHPEFVVPVRDFPVPGLEATHNSLGDWAACAACAQLIKRNQWNALVARVVVLKKRAGLPISDRAVSALRAIYRRLRENIKGAVRPIE